MQEQAQTEFERAGVQKSSGGLLWDVLGMLGQTKKWWLVPVLIVTLLMGLLILLSGTAAAPFIYTLF
jgi:Family of unknown function (DUF5989)